MSDWNSLLAPVATRMLPDGRTLELWPQLFDTFRLTFAKEDFRPEAQW